MMPMSRLCIIPCGSAKVWDKQPDAGSTPAKDVYTGGFAKACQNYAQTFFNHWIILSAKYGFLYPDEAIPAPYNVSFTKPTEDTITIPQLQQQVKEKRLDQFQEIVVNTILNASALLLIMNRISSYIR
jgi:hypothetical protein